MSESPPEDCFTYPRGVSGNAGPVLDADQMQRLCGMEPTLCRLVIDWLVDAQFLCLSRTVPYARLTDGKTSRPRAAKAGLQPNSSGTKGRGRRRREARQGRCGRSAMTMNGAFHRHEPAACTRLLTCPGI